MQHYRDSPVDLFINASSTEGTPVAVMEAISCGIPVAATAVGGNPEIVSTRNGLLLSANPTPDEIASAILSIADDPAVAEKRQGSRSTWQEKYDSKRNFQTFIATLTNLRAQKRVAS
jgi:glycosyltransferase involved in cell wall biosynthesis